MTTTNPTTFSSFFQNVDYIGAVSNANDLWFQGWTCGLGFNTGSCAAVPENTAS